MRTVTAVINMAVLNVAPESVHNTSAVPAQTQTFSVMYCFTFFALRLVAEMAGKILLRQQRSKFDEHEQGYCYP